MRRSRHLPGTESILKHGYSAIEGGCQAVSGAEEGDDRMCLYILLRARLKNQRDLSLGLFEIANCFLEGSGTKKSPDVALNYLKLAANMGDLASQERVSLYLSSAEPG